MKRKTQQILLSTAQDFFERLYKAMGYKDWKRAVNVSNQVLKMEMLPKLRRIPEPSPEKLKEGLQELPLQLAKLRKQINRALGQLAPPSLGGRPSLFASNQKKREVIDFIGEQIKLGSRKLEALRAAHEKYGASVRTLERVWAERGELLKSEKKGAKQ